MNAAGAAVYRHIAAGGNVDQEGIHAADVSQEVGVGKRHQRGAHHDSFGAD
jgi:hypothetical protein